MNTTDGSNLSFAGISTAPSVMTPANARQFSQALQGALARFIADEWAVNTVGGTGDAITVTATQGWAAYATGQGLRFVAGATNTTTSVTLNVNSIGAKAVRKISGGVDVALAVGDLVQGETYTLIYRASANSSAGGWVVVGLSVPVAQATTSTYGTTKLATLAQTLAQSPAGLVPTIENLYFPTGHLYGLTLSNNSGSAANKIDIAAGTARDDSDSYNMVLSAAITAKDVTSSWAVGSSAGGLDTGSVGNNKYYVWLIERTDRTVVDVLFSLSSTSPTMPTNYTIKVLIGEFTRAGASNGTPLWYGPSIQSGNRVTVTLGTYAAASGTAVTFTGIPAGVRRVTVAFVGISTSGTSDLLLRVGNGSVVTSGYLGATSGFQAGAVTSNFTNGFGVNYSGGTAAAQLLRGAIVLTLADAATNTWVASGVTARSDTNFTFVVGGSIALTSALDRVSLTTAGGSDTFDAGSLNILYEF